MKKNIFKKFIILAAFVFLGFNFVNATEIESLLSMPIECVAPKILNETNDACVDIVVEKEVLVCIAPKILNENNDECIDSLPEVVICVEPQILIDKVCTTPKVEPILDPLLEKSKEQVVIRNGEGIVYDGFYELPEPGTISILDKDGIAHDIDARSVIAILYGIDSLSDNFSISTLEYSGVYDSLYMKCLTPNEGENLCDNWQYVVNDSYPYVGMDKNILIGNERIYIYFGQQNRVLLNKNLIKDNEELLVTAEKYDYENNLWLVRRGVTIGVTKPDPNNPWSPNDEIQKMVDDTTGVATFSSIPEGEYNVGVKEDYYWPTEKLTVTKFIPENTSGGNAGSSVILEKNFSISKAFEFLALNQKSDGSFGSPMYTDWAAIATGDLSNSNLRSNLINYLKSNSIDTGVVTDYERRAMALMALGINPYDGTDINYIKKIIDSFDGIQLGDDSLINDDIFGLIVLKNVGYSTDDEIIEETGKYIISKQLVDGSWGSIDMTAAGIQALEILDISGGSESILKAKNYLISKQGNDGGFGNSFATSWSLQVLTNENNIAKAKKYLSLKQQIDGGLENITDDIDTRIWATAYAIPAVLQKSWDEILNDFSKVENIIEDSSSNSTENSTEEKVEEIVKPLLTQTTPEVEIIENLENKPIIKKLSTKKIEEKNPKIVKNDVVPTISPLDNNPMVASVIKADNSENGQFFSLLHKIISKIKAPFIWLLDKLGF